MTRNVVVYIHGISAHTGLPERPRLRLPGSPEGMDPNFAHTAQYDALKAGVSRRVGRGRQADAWREATHCYVEWGWDHTETDAHNLGAVHRLNDAQQRLATRAMQQMRRPWFSLVPRGVRRLSLLGLSDLFYYVSPDGNRNVKTLVEAQLAAQISEVLRDESLEIELTVIGHSAGSVIALDWVQYLFGDSSPIRMDIARLEESEADLRNLRDELILQREAFGMFGFTKGDAVAEDTLDTARLLKRFKQLVVDGRVRLRFLVTMGSPICMLALRSDKAVRGLAYDNRLPLCRMGLEPWCPGAGVKWANLWNTNDPISFPVEPMVECDPSVRDWHVRSSWDIRKSHTGYWSSKAVHGVVAGLWGHAP